VVSQGDGLGHLQVGKTGHDAVGLLQGVFCQAFLQADQFFQYPVNPAAQPQADIRGHLVVARAAGVQFFAGRADACCQGGLDVHMHIFEANGPGKVAGLNVCLNAVQAGEDTVPLTVAQHTLTAQHAGMGPGAADILGIHALVEIDRTGEAFHDWYRTDLSRRLKHPKIPYRVYTKDISPVIGIKCITEVTARDVREVLERIRESNRPTIANDTLMYMKQLFRHAIKLDLTLNNPAAAFTVDDAGGVESSKDRMLSKEEIHYAFSVFHTHINSFGRDNYLACCLFLVLGVRKSELCEAMWREMDLTTGVWDLPKERSKTGVPISIPLPRQAIAWFNELQIRACGSPYVFPARRASHRPHMGPDTLNRAISKLFGREPGRKKQPPNKMGKLEHFTVHDLRRTFRSLAASLGIAGNVAERCLNHKLKGVEGIYDRHDYFEERRIAHQTVADVIEPLVNFEPASQHHTGGR
jgi:integrase